MRLAAPEECAPQRQILEKTPKFKGARPEKCLETLGKSIFPLEECRARRSKCLERRSALGAALSWVVFPLGAFVERR